MVDLGSMALPAELVRPLRRQEYDRLVDLGAFQDERLELLYGQLVRMSPQGMPHANAVRALNRLLTKAVGERAVVQVQLPLAASDESEPEPDLAIVADVFYVKDHPASALLVVEVADSSLDRDLGVKARLYAEMGVADYWVVDLANGLVIVHRAPVAGAYTRIDPFKVGQRIGLAAFPDVEVAVSDLFAR